MIERFQGTEGRRRLVAALRGHKIVQNDDALANSLADAALLCQFDKGKMLAAQGSADNDIYLILCGSVSIFVNGREMAVRKANYHVGEMALIEPTEPRSATLLALEDTVVAKISEPAFTKVAEDYPDLWRRLALEIAHRLRERSKHVSSPNPKPEVFIGCSVEKLEEARQVQGAFTHDEMIVRLWENGVFGASSFPIDDLLNQVKRSDFAILVLGGEDKVISRKTASAAPRDNVVFELGLFMGTLGRERTFIVMERGKNIKIPTDLLGLTPLQYQSGSPDNLVTRLSPVCTEIRNIVKKLGSK